MNNWDRENAGTGMAIQGLVQSVDLLTDSLERKWGTGRLRLLVEDGLRERFDRQWRKWQAAYAAQDLAAVQAHSEAMRRAWAALHTHTRDSCPCAAHSWRAGELGICG